MTSRSNDIQSGTGFRRSRLAALRARRDVVESGLEDLRVAIEQSIVSQTPQAEIEALRQAWGELRQELLSLSSQIRTLEQIELEARTQALSVSFNRRTAPRRSFTTQRP